MQPTWYTKYRSTRAARLVKLHKHPRTSSRARPEVLAAASMIGTRDELLDQLQQLADAGLDQVMILPNFDTRFDVLEQVGLQIIGNL